MRRLLLLLTVLLVPAAPAQAAWVWPVRGDVITPYRNGTDPYASGQHRGIDIAAAVGTRVVAAAGGEVRFAGTAGSSGLTISIRTSDGYDTSYLHLSSLGVRAGTQVSTGARIGAVGTTGTRSATAPHLHFGVRDEGTRHAYHDPMAFLPSPPAAPAPEPPVPAPAPAPAPVPPAPAPAPAPLAPVRARVAPGPAPALGPKVGPVRRPAQLPHPPWTSPALTGNRSPAASIDPSDLQGRAAEPPLHRQPAAGPAAPRHRRAGGPAGAAHARAPFPSATSIAPHPSDHAGASSHAAGATRAGTAARDPDGPDIGWALACGALLLAAAALGLSDDRLRSTRPARSALARLRMPLPRG